MLFRRHEFIVLKKLEMPENSNFWPLLYFIIYGFGKITFKASIFPRSLEKCRSKIRFSLICNMCCWSFFGLSQRWPQKGRGSDAFKHQTFSKLAGGLWKKNIDKTYFWHWLEFSLSNSIIKVCVIIFSLPFVRIVKMSNVFFLN